MLIVRGSTVGIAPAGKRRSSVLNARWSETAMKDWLRRQAGLMAVAPDPAAHITLPLEG